MSNIKDLESEISLNLNKLSTNEVLFITGAGVSAATPTRFPTGNELHELILNTFTTLRDSEIQRLINQNHPF